jgi:putative peptidoglycan lipid II flippase
MARVSSVTGQGARWRMFLNIAIVMAGTLLSRILGLAREAIFSYQFGSSPELGAFRAAFTIPDLLYLVIIGGALGSALIPVFGRLIQNEDEERAWELANTILTLAFAVFLVIATVVAIFAGPLLALTVALGYASDPELFEVAVRLMRLMLIQPLLLGLGGLMMSLLQTFDRFALPTVAFNIYNIAIIAAAWFLAPRYGIDALAWGVVGGAALYFLILVPAVAHAGLRFKPSFNWRMPEVRRIGVLLAPRLIGQGALQINVIVMVSLISLIGSQAQAANGYAYQLLMLPLGLAAVSVGTVMFPRLARLFATGQFDDMRAVYSQTLRLVLWVVVPASILLTVLHVPIVRLLFQRGQFDSESLELTSRALLFYAPAAIGLAGTEIVIRTFYAMEDTQTPVIIGVATLILNGLLTWWLIASIRKDIGFVALAFTVTNSLEFVVLLSLLRYRFDQMMSVSYAPTVGRSMLVLGASAAVLIGVLFASIWLAVPYVPGVTLDGVYGQSMDFFILGAWLAATCIVGLLVYVAVGALLGAPEVHQLWALVRQRRAN